MKNSIFLVLFMIFGFGILYFILKSQESTPELENALIGDDDKDGVSNQIDLEKNTLWLSDTSSFNLRNYVAADGTLDRIKVDSLCNCFAVPDSAERAKIKCKDNADYFVFEGKLWHYDDSTNRFYDKDGSAIKNGNNAISEMYDLLMDDVKIIVDKNNGVKSSRDVVFNNIKYNVPYKLTSEKGITFNEADYRYYSGKWETRKVSGKGSWENANANDINFLLAKKAEKFDGNKEEKDNTKIKEVIEDTNVDGDNYYLKFFKGGNVLMPLTANICLAADDLISSNYPCNTANGKKARDEAKTIAKMCKQK